MKDKIIKDKLIILGAGIMQGPAIKIAKELGIYTIVLDGSSNAPCIPMADQFEQIDLKEKEEIETFARSVQGSCSRLGIMTAGTDFSASVAWTAQRLGLPGIPYEAALNASDKSRMRACFKKASLPSPDFYTITSEDPFDHIPLPFPVVIKPVDNMGGRGCRRVNTIEEFADAAKDAIKYSRSGRAIVESFMDGHEFSVDAIVCHDEIIICGLADRHIFFPPYFIEMGHTMPTVIEEEKQQTILETFRAGVRALGIAGKNNTGAAKGDIKLTADGPMIGEIAARLSGGFMSGWTYPYSSGVQPIRAAILAAIGKTPDNLVPVKKWTCAERAFISIPGTVKTITGMEQAENQNNVKDLFLRIKEGVKVSFPENNVSKCGNIIACAPDRAAAMNAAESAARLILIKLDHKDPETAEFLKFTPHRKIENKVYTFPPDAFELPEYLKEALSLFPDNQQPLSTNKNSPQVAHTSNKLDYSIRPFPEFTSSELTDYMGRTIEESLEAVRLLTGFTLPITIKNAENKILGKSFWAALIRGGYQGAVYYIENLEINEKAKSKHN
ncbi:MAG: ATP-grasp domain-containing protein [Treponema sp.]|jgi:biotin carboxylase|nr:ATP-grasp domain-containing protein [Treponema sp.]